ncbi:MAG: hypothetical protein V1495_10795, partial [Pseudomonadota bacterium]
VSTSQITLQFTDNSMNEDSFVVQRKIVPPSPTPEPAFGDLQTLSAHAGTGSVTFADTSVVAGTTYKYRVLAKKGSLSSFSNELSVTAPGGPPSAPQNVREHDFAEGLLGGTKWICTWDVVWDHPASDPTGAGITYRYCLDRYHQGVLELDNWCTMIPAGALSQPEGTWYFFGQKPRDWRELISTVTAFRDGIEGGSASVSVTCGYD